MSEGYRLPALARYLHKLPHINITLHYVNSTFAPHSEVYLESIGILGSIPAAWLILTLLVLLIYLLTRCCDRKPRPAKSIKALKVTLIILAILCLGAIGVGLYGNDDLHNAILQALQAGRQLAAIIGTVRNQSDALEQALGSRARNPLTRLADALDAPAANQTALGALLRALAAVRGNASVAASAARDLRRPLRGLDLDGVLQWATYWETVRWIAAMCAWGALACICVALLAAAARHSRRALIALSVCSLGGVVVCWLAASASLATSVALSDACQNPVDAVAMHAPTELPNEVVRYYLSCEVSRGNPFTARLRDAQRAALAVRQALATLARVAPKVFNDPGLQPALGALSAETASAERALGALAGALDCRGARAANTAAAIALCDPGLLGLALQLVAAVTAGLLFTALVWLDSHAWIYIRNKGEYNSGDERAPFLSGGSAGSGGGAAGPASNGGAALSGCAPPRSALQGSYCGNGAAGSPTAPPPPPSYSAAVALSGLQLDEGPMTPMADPFHRYHRDEANGRSAGMVGSGRGATAGGARVGGGGRGGHLRGGGGAAGGCHTLGRLPSHTGPSAASATNNGKYATLSKQCKTLESNDFY